MSVNIKIFSTQRIDKETDVVENEIYVPIRCGAVFDKRKTTMIGDNTGDNISCKRMSYCELTTQYWAWKNVEADYYGFCHYRRYFSFNKQKLESDVWNTVIMDHIDEDTKKKIIVDPDQIKDRVTKYDVLAPVPVELNRVDIDSVYDQYKMAPQLHQDDLDIMLEIIEEMYPEYQDAAKQYMYSNKQFLCNMFVMRKDLFFQYSEFLFGVLSEFEKRNPMEDYSEEGARTPGHLGERLFGIFFTYLQEEGIYRLGNQQIVAFRYPEKAEVLKKKYGEDSVNVVFSSSEYYTPYCASAIQSILDHRSTDRAYDIVVLEQDMQDKTKKRLLSMCNGLDNVSIRTFNVSRYFAKYQLRVLEHFSVETYFRLVIPELMKEYKKVLYLDGDLIAMTNIEELYDENIQGYIAAAALDIIGMGIVNGFKPEKVAYYKNHVRMKNYKKQANGGVLLLNLERIRDQYTSEELLKYAQISNFDLCDQDVMNSLFEGQFKWIDLAWNATDDEKQTLRGYVATFAPAAYYKQYQMAIKNPKIIHYAGTIKPWHDPAYTMAEEFWNVLKKTPFYEIVEHRRMAENAQAFAYAAISSTPKKEDTKKKQYVSFHKMTYKLLPMGTRRREFVKKVAYLFVGKEHLHKMLY